MIETAIIRIRGERFLFRSFDHGLGEQPEAHGKANPLVPIARTNIGRTALKRKD